MERKKVKRRRLIWVYLVIHDIFFKGETESTRHVVLNCIAKNENDNKWSRVVVP